MNTNKDMMKQQDFTSIFILGLLENENAEELLCDVMTNYEIHIIGREEDKLKATHLKIALENVKKYLEGFKKGNLNPKTIELLTFVDNETSEEINLDENYDPNNTALFKFDTKEWKFYKLITYFRTFLKDNIFEFCVKLLLLKYDFDVDKEENKNSAENFSKIRNDFTKSFNDQKRLKHSRKKAYKDISNEFANLIEGLYNNLTDESFFKEYKGIETV